MSRRRDPERLDLRGRWLVLTGASSGLGEAMAGRLAGDHGANLVLVARREARLRALAARLAERHGTTALVLAADLADRDAPQRIFSESTARAPIFGLLSVAGQHRFGPHEALTEAEAEAMLRVNALAPIGLLERFLPWMDARGEGGALVVTSIAARMATPFQALYGGTKAMLDRTVENLRHERAVLEKPAFLTVCAAGGMWTPMLADSPVAGAIRQSRLMRATMLSADEVARVALDAFLRRRASVVPGRLNRAMLATIRLLPSPRWGLESARHYKRGLM